MTNSGPIDANRRRLLGRIGLAAAAIYAAPALVQLDEAEAHSGGGRTRTRGRTRTQGRTRTRSRTRTRGRTRGRTRTGRDTD